jgi:diadenosine tetraphosphatase ApaH/serine/threonine PP2A family protein phosphatase
MKVCEGITLQKERCKGLTDGASAFCHRHQGQPKRVWCHQPDCKSQAQDGASYCAAHLTSETTTKQVSATDATEDSPSTPVQPAASKQALLASPADDLHFVSIQNDNNTPAIKVKEQVAWQMQDQGDYGAPTGTEGTWKMVCSGVGNTVSYQGPATFGRMIQEMLGRRFVEKKKKKKNFMAGVDESHEWRSSKIDLACIKELCHQVKDKMTVNGSALLLLQGPAYVLGDFHGNYHDLSFFLARCCPFGADIMPFQYVFLGDYVDRGPHSLEVVLRLFALKLAYPRNVWLLRGNHEDPSINSKLLFPPDFRSACLKYDKINGDEIWRMVNDVFDHMPLAAIIEEGQKKIFCCHGGIPRSSNPEILNQIRDIRVPITVPIYGVDQNGELRLANHENPLFVNPIILDLLWADPMRPQEKSYELRGQLGFGPNFGPNERSEFGKSHTARGEYNCSTFSNDAARDFFNWTGCSYLIRAHEHRKLGLAIQGEGTIITLFSTSSYKGSDSLASILLFSGGRLTFIILDSGTGLEAERTSFDRMHNNNNNNNNN